MIDVRFAVFEYTTRIGRPFGSIHGHRQRSALQCVLDTVAIFHPCVAADFELAGLVETGLLPASSWVLLFSADGLIK
jgi:hypothetical protein